jgi:hypothetical protein
MVFILDEYIDEYIRKSKTTRNKEIARHLKKIIPKTSHLNESIFKKAVEEIKTQIENDREKDFENAFFKVCEKYVLKGDIIEADLPGILTRIIPNRNKFLLNIEYQHKKPYAGRELNMAFTSGDMSRIIRTLGKLRKAALSNGKVVFATFDEEHRDRDPFSGRKVIEIINQLALDKEVYDDAEPYTAVKLRYRNSKKFDKRYPTFIDAGWRDTFYPADKKDKYGRTRSLDPLLPDMPEVVHENMKLADVIVEEFEFLKDE